MKTKPFCVSALALCVIALVACAAPTPTATPTPIREFVVIAGGDTQNGCNAAAKQTASLLDTFPSDTLILHSGDMTDKGTPNEFNDCYGLTWGRHKSQHRPVPGNHDYDTPGASGYWEYFGALAGTRDQGYYSFNLGAWHIVALNSEIDHSASSAQVQWLKTDLAANPSQCILAYWHNPRFSSGAHGSDPSVAPFWDALNAARADVVFHGHEHNYERFAKQNPSGEPDANGIREFVIGTGGGRLFGLRTALPTSEVRDGITYGIGKFTLRAGSYDWQFVPVAGGTFTDSGTTQCNPKPSR
jgi:3',5'-cyclic AMP phosphodiesterase CpdA